MGIESDNDILDIVGLVYRDYDYTSNNNNSLSYFIDVQIIQKKVEIKQKITTTRR